MTSRLNSVETEEECSYLPAELSSPWRNIQSFVSYIWLPSTSLSLSFPWKKNSQGSFIISTYSEEDAVWPGAVCTISWWMFLSLSCYEKSCSNQLCRSLFSFLWCRYLEVAIPRLPFGETVSLFSGVSVHFWLLPPLSHQFSTKKNSCSFWVSAESCISHPAWEYGHN